MEDLNKDDRLRHAKQDRIHTVVIDAGARRASTVPQGGDRVPTEARRDHSPACISGLAGLDTAADHPVSIHLSVEEVRVKQGDRMPGRVIDIGSPYELEIRGEQPLSSRS